MMLTPFALRKVLIPSSLLLAGLVLAAPARANPKNTSPSQITQALKAIQAAQKAAQAHMAHALKALEAAQKAAQTHAAQVQRAQMVAQKAAVRTIQVQATQAQRMVRQGQHAVQKVAQTEMAVALGQIANDLHATKLLLESADRDYEGHRGAAVKGLTAAIQELGGSTKAQGPAGNNEPQSLSDKQLKAAIAELATIQEQLASVPLPRAAKAAAGVGSAIKELKKAVAVR